MRTRRRMVVKVAAFLLLGAIINVAVAWGLAITVNAQEGGPTDRANLIQDQTHWGVNQYSRRGALQYSSKRVRNPMRERRIEGNESLLSEWKRFEKPLPEYIDGTLFAEGRLADLRGWPMLSLWSETRQNIIPKLGPTAPIVFGAITVPELRWPYGPSFPRALPLRPLWLGFIANTFYYAIPVALLYVGIGAVKRRRRIKRGECVRCAYPVGTNDKCTECGGVV